MNLKSIKHNKIISDKFSNIQIALIPELKYISFTKTLLSDYFKQRIINKKQYEKARICLEEILTNIIEHNAAQINNQLISLNFECSINSLKIEICANEQTAITDIIDNQNTTAAIDNFKKNFKGAGILLIKHNSDKFEYVYENKTSKYILEFYRNK